MGRALHKLTSRRIERLAEPGWYGDGGNLWVRIDNNGSKRWVFVWIRDKRRREMGLGSLSNVSLDDARQMAAAGRELLKEGLDPISMRLEAAAQSKIEEAENGPKVEARRDTSEAPPKFLDYARTYISAHEEGWSNEKHRWQWTNSLTKHAKAILEQSVDAITVDDMVTVLKPIWSQVPDTAGRVRGRVESILDAARVQKHIKGPWENPARWKGNLEYLLPKRKRLAKGHYAAMPYDEMPDFFASLRERPAPAARALELTILCATRTHETLEMRWGEVDLDKAVWTIPAERMKMRVEHRVPLAPAAVEILKDLAGNESRPPSAYVFAGQKVGKPLSAMAMAMVMRRMELAHFTVHGMRSSFRDYMGDMTDHPENIIEHALAHQVGDSTKRAYRRKDAFEKRKLVMADWARYLLPSREDEEKMIAA